MDPFRCIIEGWLVGMGWGWWWLELQKGMRLTWGLVGGRQVQEETCLRGGHEGRHVNMLGAPLHVYMFLKVFFLTLAFLRRASF